MAKKALGRRRLENTEMMERLIRDQIEELYTKSRKHKNDTNQPELTPSDTKKLVDLAKVQDMLDERKSKLKLKQAETESDVEEFTISQIHENIRKLKEQEAKLEDKLAKEP